MTRFDSVVVGNDFVSEHWLAEQFPKTVTSARAAWKEREEHEKPTPRSGLKAIAARFGRDLVRLREGGSEEKLRELHAEIRRALLIPGEEQEWTSERAGGEMTVPAVAPASPTGTALLVLQAHDAGRVEDLLDADGVGHLLTPATVDGAPETATAAVISGLFRTEDAPPLVLVTAGAWLLLAERGSWPEGRWLAVDLATVLERGDTKAGGELETVAALTSGESLLPETDGTAPLLALLEESVKHAVGVSKDLRDGVRESIELLASDVLARRREHGLPDDAPHLADDLTRQCLRFLYRILFLLYAEARPELGVLPVGAPEYSEGYGLDRLRELVLIELTSEKEQTGTHLYQSLGLLFRLVNDGYPPETLGDDPAPDDDGGQLRFEALRADLFSRDATALIHEVGLGNAGLQQVLERLLLSKKQRKRDRGFVSYAQLGINQLGAVYEGLMSYSGSIARDHMVEVAKDGDPGKGSWVVPVSSTEGFDDAWFVMRDNEENGDRERVTYAPGDFVFRLSGRERQRSASYYTPEVLTRCVVTHSLAELLDQNDTVTPASRILELSVCEPALGSGAFLIEAINQLADQYLSRRQRELGEEIPPEQYPAEKQKVKAYLALHNCYGVDLNATAVELAEITLWLDAMHPGLRAPWFGLHLKRGNSLIGARRESWSTKELDKRGWLTTVPTAHGLDTEFPDGRVHHFLLPCTGWAAVADTKEAKELRPESADTLRKWRRSVTTTLTKAEIATLQNLARRVEMLWALARRRMETAEAGIRRTIAVWGLPSAPDAEAVTREQIEDSFADAGSAYRRLRLVMDAWAAMWFWPVTTDVAPPTRDDWLAALGKLLGTVTRTETKRGRGLWSADATWSELDDAEHNEVSFGQMRAVDDVLAAHPWLGVCSEIAEREGFFHWELDFAAVFARGGFDLQVGNPPWVRPDWDDALALAEDDAWFGLAEKPPSSTVSHRRAAALKGGDDRYLHDRTSLSATSEHLGSPTDRPVLAKTRPDLYRCFMERTWRSRSPTGIIGLLHPESHFHEARASELRRASYSCLRRHWQFRNELRLFTELVNKSEFGVFVYGRSHSIAFLHASSLIHPDTVSRSLAHDGAGPEPGIRDELDKWNAAPHRSRIIHVDVNVLSNWAALIDAPGTPPTEARMLGPVNTSSQSVLRKIARSKRFVEVEHYWTSGWNETTDRNRGIFIPESATPRSLNEVILQGPHFSVANPYAKQPNTTMRSNKDYADWDLELLPEFAIPRTNYQPVLSQQNLLARYPRWNEAPSSTFWRIAWRNMANSENVRTLYPAILPPGPMHVHGVHTLTTASLEDLAHAAGMWASIPVDFLVKVRGAANVQTEFVLRFPHEPSHLLSAELALRCLRLNCLTAHYSDLWAELFDDSWAHDSWTRDDLPAAPIGEVGRGWTMSTPLRRDAERRQALVEIDALAAVMLGITAEELCAIYRTQFGVLRKYERVMQFDANGRQVPKDVLKDYEKRGTRAELGRYELPFAGVDREKEMTIAHENFSARLRRITT